MSNDICDDPKCNCRNVEPNFRVWLHDKNVTPTDLKQAAKVVIQSCKQLEEAYKVMEELGMPPILPGQRERNLELIKTLENENWDIKIN